MSGDDENAAVNVDESSDENTAVDADEPTAENGVVNVEESGDRNDDGEEETVRPLVERVAEFDEDAAEAVGSRLEELEAERAEHSERADDLESRLKRTQADFQNYKKRAKKRQGEIRKRATEDLVERLVDVRDNLVRAVDADHEDVESLREGVEMTLSEFDRVLEEEGVSEIAPEAGVDVDPQRHEVMMRVESNQPEGTIESVYQPGYEMAGTVIQAAQVTVSDGSNDGGDEE